MLRRRNGALALQCGTKKSDSKNSGDLRGAFWRGLERAGAGSTERMRQRRDSFDQRRNCPSEIVALDSGSRSRLIHDGTLAARVRTRHHRSIAIPGHLFAALPLLRGHFNGLSQACRKREREQYNCQGNRCELGCSVQHFYSTPANKPRVLWSSTNKTQVITNHRLASTTICSLKMPFPAFWGRKGAVSGFDAGPSWVCPG